MKHTKLIPSSTFRSPFDLSDPLAVSAFVSLSVRSLFPISCLCSVTGRGACTRLVDGLIQVVIRGRGSIKMLSIVQNTMGQLVFNFRSELYT